MSNAQTRTLVLRPESTSKPKLGSGDSKPLRGAALPETLCILYLWRRHAQRVMPHDLGNILPATPMEPANRCPLRLHYEGMRVLCAPMVNDSPNPNYGDRGMRGCMNESACFSDLSLYELDRFHWLLDNNGSLNGFTTRHGSLLQDQVADAEELKAHQIIPGSINALVLSHENRQALGQVLNEYKPTLALVTDHDVALARSFVAELFSTSLPEVQVLRVPTHVMESTALGAVYSNGSRKHVIVVPEQSFDPLGVLVRQFAIAAHYTLMREKPGLAAMISDDLTQAMVGQYAVLRFAAQHPDKCSVTRHLQLMVSWEFAKGLIKTPEMPMGFIASDLGEQLMRAYGTGMFRAIVQELYEGASNGRAIWFGSTNFTGSALALFLLGDDYGMTTFMRNDTGNRKLGDKLRTAFGGEDCPDWFEGVQEVFNSRLATITKDAKADAVFAEA